MKTATNSISPFIILLVPVILAIVLTISSAKPELNPEKYEAASYFRMPSWTGVVQAIF